MRVRYRIAAYLRLSKEDEGREEESGSIASQRAMLKGYVQKNFADYEWNEFSDDGFSGTNFMRPGVAAMLEQIRDGRIDCVIVKDFSRFSRDYIELGSYLEQVFPFLGVRFISLNDHYDSARYAPGLETSFKGLMYDLYSKDLSLKVKSSLYARKKQGQYASAHAPFGYAKDAADRHRLVIAEDEAAVVRKIFSLALGGMTSTEIARLLNREHIKTPMGFKMAKKRTATVACAKRYYWDGAAICSMLKNPVYVGDMVYGKYKREEVGGKDCLKPRSEWQVYKNHHAAIISREEFEQLQVRRACKGNGRIKKRACAADGTAKNPADAMNGRAKKRQFHHPLQGKVFCGGCGRALALKRDRKTPYFCCRQQAAAAQETSCIGRMDLMFLEQSVLKQMCAKTEGIEKLEKLKQEQKRAARREIDNLHKERERLLRQKTELWRKRLTEYESAVRSRDKCMGKNATALSKPGDGCCQKYPNGKERRHETVSGQPEEHMRQTDAGISAQIKRLEEKLRQIEIAITRFQDALCETPPDLDADMRKEFMDACIEKVMVYDKADIQIIWKAAGTWQLSDTGGF